MIVASGFGPSCEQVGGGRFSQSCGVDNSAEITIRCDFAVTGAGLDLAFDGKDADTCVYRFSAAHVAGCPGMICFLLLLCEMILFPLLPSLTGANRSF